MSRRSKTIWMVAVAVAVAVALLSAGWWALMPAMHTATAAELRSHVAPELLLPLPHPDGGAERYAQLRVALDALPVAAAIRKQPLDADDPAMQRVLDILAAGPLDRTQQATDTDMRPVALAERLTIGTTATADAAAWERVQRQLEAEYLLLDRLAASDASSGDVSVTLGVETTVYKATLALAARRDAPATVLKRLATLVAVDRHDPERVQQVLRGDFQLFEFPWIARTSAGDSPASMPWQYTGSYEPIETVTLVSDRFVEMVGNAALPVPQWSRAAQRHVEQAVSAQPASPRSLARIAWLWYRLRMNNSANSGGRWLAMSFTNRWQYSNYDNRGGLIDQLLFLRMRREQAMAAVAVARFRQARQRDPRGFQELLDAGLLQSAPLDPVTGQALAFDLNSLFKWPVQKSVFTRSALRN